MLKKYISLFFCMFLVFALIGGCTKNDKDSKIVSDVLSLEKSLKPDKLEGNISINTDSINIDDILKKYIYVGMPEKDAIRFLKRDGFKIRKDAQKSVLHAYYLLASSYFTLPPYRIVISISTVDGKVSEFSGVFK